jgi:hypothetical protein
MGLDELHEWAYEEWARLLVDFLTLSSALQRAERRMDHWQAVVTGRPSSALHDAPQASAESHQIPVCPSCGRHQN